MTTETPQASPHDQVIPQVMALTHFASTDAALEADSKVLGEYFNMAAQKSGAAHFATDWVTGFMMMIGLMNQTYKLPLNGVPSLDLGGEAPADRVRKFMGTIAKEMAEGEEIINAMNGKDKDGNPAEFTEADILTMLGDWLADFTVYIFSESRKYGLHLPNLIDIVMASNFSKLNTDGTPIIDEALGKFEKGPNYIKPERIIAEQISTFAVVAFQQQEQMQAAMRAQAEARNAAAAAAQPGLLVPSQTLVGLDGAPLHAHVHSASCSHGATTTAPVEVSSPDDFPADPPVTTADNTPDPV